MKQSHSYRAISSEEREAFHRDGVICLRGLYSGHWVEQIAEALEEICAIPSPINEKTGSLTSDGFRSDAFTWMTNDRVRDFVLQGPSAEVVQRVFGSESIRFFYDQIFVKRRLTPDPTPWHQDATFWPIKGQQVASLWTSVDPVDARTSALEFVGGSHLWPQRFEAVAPGGLVLSDDKELEAPPDIEADRSKYNILSWELEPGDALLFHALTLHGSRGNQSPRLQRRAITTRWCGDDVAYAPKGRQMPIAWNHGLAAGDLLSGPVFPRVFPSVLEHEVSARMAGPLMPDLVILSGFLAEMDQMKRVAVR